MSGRLLLEVRASRFGLWFLPGLAVLLVAIWLWLFWLPAREAQLHAILDQVEQAAHAPRAASQVAAVSDVQALAVDPQQALRQIIDLAGARNLRIAQAEYRRAEAGRVGRMQMLAPVQGSYPDIRYWLREVHEKLPSVSLDEIGMRREDQGVQAKVLFSVWYAVGPREETP